MSKTNFSNMQKITVAALIGMGVFNPMSVEILEDYFKMVYTAIFIASAAWVVFYILKKTLTPEPVHIPNKTDKTKKAGKFVE